MTERSVSFDPASIAEGDELVFDDDGAGALPAPPKAKRVKAGRKATAEDPPAPIDIAPGPAAFAPPPAGSGDVALPAATASALPMPAWLLVAALGLSLLTSTIACVGLLVASRTIAGADAARSLAEAQSARLAGLPGTLEKLDALVTQEQAALAGLKLGRAGQPATIGDVQRGLDGLRAAIAQAQPARDQELVALTKAGQSELAERISGIADTLDAMNDRQTKRAGR